MEIVIPHKNNSVDNFIELFSANGFSVDNKNIRQVSFKYLNLIVKVNRIPPSVKINNLEIYTYKLNPNSRYMVSRFMDDHTIYTIDFPALIKELNGASKAALNREGLRKAVKFQVTMYKPYLLKLFDDIGLSKDHMTNLYISNKSIDVSIKIGASRYELRIPCYSNKDMEKFLYGEFSALEGRVDILSEGITKFGVSIKVDEFILNTLKTVKKIYDDYGSALNSCELNMNPKRKDMEDKIRFAKMEFTAFQEKNLAMYPIISSYRQDIQDVYK